MTLLELTNRLRQECGVSGSDLTTVVGVSGESKRCRDWIVQAWVEIQQEYPTFDWMRASVSFNTTAQQQAYTPSDSAPTGAALADFGSWDMESFRLYRTSTGTSDESFLSEMDYKSFRDYYIFSSFRTSYSRPISIAQRPNDKALLLGPSPDAVYTVVGEYFKTPTEMSLDADEPSMPSRFHFAIIYRAMQSYALYEAAPEVLTRGQTGYSEMIKRIEFDQMQDVTMAGAFA